MGGAPFDPRKGSGFAVQRNAISAHSFGRADGARLKRAAWIALFVLGLCFWIPGLLRARLGASAVTETPDVGSQTTSDVALPATMAEAPATIPAGSAAICRAAAVPTSRLVVTATILGKSRRAAIVNGRLYREGDKVIAGSELYRLASVAEGRIDFVSLGPGCVTKRIVSLKASAESERDPSGSH
jgi:hypothetical protein